MAEPQEQHDEPSEAPQVQPVTRRVAVSGASGLIGARLCELLGAQGVRVDPLVRREPQAKSTEIRWDPYQDQIDAAALAGVDSVVHLAGENVAAGAWTPERKQTIRESRVRSTALLAETLARLKPRPRVFLCASAVGYYGDRSDEILTEDSIQGRGFLADVCSEWEDATFPAHRAGIRVVNLRIGMVLARTGGALARMLPIFRSGLGGQVGKGRQYVSWIALTDLVRAMHYLMFADAISGPVNAVSPHPVTNAEMTKTLGWVLERPTVLTMPTPAVKLMFGEMGKALLLASARVLPTKLQSSGFQFQWPDLEPALRGELGLPR